MTLRIFVSSPGDVPVERDRAAAVVARLQEEFAHYAALEPFFWEDQPALATATFQSQFPEAAAMDIVVGILWARIGTPLPLDKVRPKDGRRYESGTVYELETAAESYQSRGSPDLVVYRRTSDPSLPLDNEAERQRRLEQLEALEAFIRRWFFHDDGSFKAAFHTFKTPDQFEQQLETHLRKLIRDKVEKAEQPGGLGEGEIVFHGVPYPGLKVFGLEDAPVFYGRARALAAVKEALRAQAERNCAFLLIFGMSGSGKSSLVRAGLVHALTAMPGWIEGIDRWRWCLVRPGDATGDPLDALAQAFFGDMALPELRAAGIDATRLARTLRDNPDDVDLILGPALRAVADAERERRAADRPFTARLLVVVDQLEELFTRDWLDEPGRVRYVAALAALARSGLVWVSATMRSEFFARCAELPELAALKEGQGQLDLLPPTFAEIGQMIRYPARDAALRWGKEPDNPSQALDDMLQEAAWRDSKALPLLQFTLNELFRRRDGRTLTCEAYRALGGLEGALANHAEATLAALPPEVQAALPALLRALVTAGEGDHEPVVSRRVPLGPLRIVPIRRRLFDVLTDARLLLTDRDDRMQPVAGIAHEALLTHWPRLKDLLEKDREFLRARTRAAVAAERWLRESRQVDFLLHEGKPIAEARELLKTRRADLDSETIEFIDQSIRYRTRQRRRRTRAITTITGIVLIGVSAYAALSTQSLKLTVRLGLLAVADAKTTQLDIYVRERRADLNVVRQSPTLVDAIQQLSVLRRKEPLDSPAYLELARTVRPFVAHFAETSDYTNYYIFDTDGTVLFRLEPTRDMGSNLLSGPLKGSELAGVFDRVRTLLQVEISDYQVYSGQTEPAAFIAGPVFTPQGRVVGFVALELANEQVFRVFKDYNGLGETGEAVVTVRSGQTFTMVAPPRHDPGAVATFQGRFGDAKATAMQKAVQGQRGYGEAIDYRGRKVVAAWSYLPSFRWGMVVKQDVDEAFELINRNRKAIALLIVVTFLAVTLIALWLARSIT